MVIINNKITEGRQNCQYGHICSMKYKLLNKKEKDIDQVHFMH